MKTDKIKLKIKALLSKTPENGATFEEAAAALAKANELMTLYFIELSDLSDPFLEEKLGSVEVPVYKTSFDLTNFLGWLSATFDVEHNYNAHRIFFFGYEQDLQLAAYFYKLITVSVMKEKDAYKKTEDYKELTSRGVHGRTLTSHFIKGFIHKINLKLRNLYNERESEARQNAKHGLVLVTKQKKVKAGYDEIKGKVHVKAPAAVDSNSVAFQSGMKKAEDFQLTQGLADHKKQSTKTLS